MGVLGQESVTRMDGIDVADFGGADHAVDFQITVGTRGFTDADGFIGELDVEGIDVGFRVNRERFDPELLAGANNAQRDLASVGDQNLIEHGSFRWNGR
jgi:hypothetical protein